MSSPGKGKTSIVPIKDKFNPDYYMSSTHDAEGWNYETVNIAEAFFAHSPHLATAFIYQARAGRKSETSFEEDIRKAIWWLERSIKFHNRPETANEAEE